MIQEAQRLAVVQEYYFSTKLREVSQLLSEGKPIINLGVGSPDLPPPSAVVNALNNSMSHANAHQYQSYQGLLELREAVADFYLKHYNVELNPSSDILPLMGSKEGIMHISMAFLNPGDQVLIPNPGYPTYHSVCQLVGAEAVFYDLKEETKWLPDLKELERLDMKRVKLMWINYPHMPTGAKGNLELFQELVSFAKKHHILLVNDNPYSFILNKEPTSLLQIKEAENHCLELNSMSKTFNMSGWRVGMLLGKASLIHSVLKVKSNMDSGMFYGIQKGAIAALQTNELWFEQQNKIYEKRRWLTEALAEKLGCEVFKDSVGLFVWAKMPENSGTAEDFINRILHEKHLFITPGSLFGSNGAHYIRFSLCVNEEQLNTALSRI